MQILHFNQSDLVILMNLANLVNLVILVIMVNLVIVVILVILVILVNLLWGPSVWGPNGRGQIFQEPMVTRQSKQCGFCIHHI